MASQIFIANPTLHARELHIRPSKNKVQIMHIRACGQEFFPGDIESADLPAILKQIEKAGGVPASDTKAIRHRFSLLYTVSDAPVRKPIPADKINAALKQDEQVRQDLAGEAIEKGTVSAFNTGQEVGGREITLEVTEVDDRGKVAGGADFEVTAAHRPTKGGRRTEKKR